VTGEHEYKFAVRVDDFAAVSLGGRTVAQSAGFWRFVVDKKRDRLRNGSNRLLVAQVNLNHSNYQIEAGHAQL
jgi:hypothetical protein